MIPTLSFTQAVKQAAGKVVQFTGRSRRSEYWWTMLLVFGISAIAAGSMPVACLLLNLAVIPLTFRRLHDTGRSGWWWGAQVIAQWVLLIAVAVDTGQLLLGHDPKGLLLGLGVGMIKYMVLLGALAVYQIVLLVLLCQDSQPGENKYGPNPKCGQESENQY